LKQTTTTPAATQRRWSIELVLVIALPLSAVLGCGATLYLALRTPAHESITVDRFGHVVQPSR